MKIIRAIETEYAAIRSLNSEEGDVVARVYATLLIATQLMPVVYTLTIPYITAVTTQTIALLDVFFCIAVMTMFVDKRRESFPQICLSLSDNRSKFVIASYIFMSILVFCALSSSPPYYSLIAYLVFAIVPIDLLLSNDKDTTKHKTGPF